MPKQISKKSQQDMEIGKLYRTTSQLTLFYSGEQEGDTLATIEKGCVVMLVSYEVLPRYTGFSQNGEEDDTWHLTEFKILLQSGAVETARIGYGSGNERTAYPPSSYFQRAL